MNNREAMQALLDGKRIKVKFASERLAVFLDKHGILRNIEGVCIESNIFEHTRDWVLAEESNPIAPIDKDFQVLAKEIDVLKYRIKQLREESNYIFGLKIKERLDRIEHIHPVPKQNKLEDQLAAIRWHQNQFETATWTKESLEGKEPPI